MRGREERGRERRTPRGCVSVSRKGDSDVRQTACQRWCEVKVDNRERPWINLNVFPIKVGSHRRLHFKSHLFQVSEYT